MKLTIQIWQHHSVIEKQSFKSKKEAHHWLNTSGYRILNDDGGCFIQVIVNGKELTICQMVDEGWC